MQDRPNELSGPPAQLAHYCIDARLGSGGMGEVFRATDTRLDRPVAIKIMRTREHTEDGVATRRFLREARAASALNHPNIVTVHQIDATDAGEHFIVQELVEGQTLRELMEESLAVEKVCEIGRQAAHALAAAHESGIVHRDIKPENMMLRSDGYVKILDFGLARLSERPGVDSTTTLESEVGTLTGTPAYMSPEQTGGETVGSPSDIWSLGVVLYEMLTGNAPFGGRTTISVIASVLSAHPAPLDSTRSDTPGALADLVHGMLDKEPDRRPTAREVEGVLTGLLSGGGALAATAVTAARRSTVGRDQELARLMEAYRCVNAGRSGIMAITGEPGIGKTSLLNDFLATVRDLPDLPTIAVGRCSESLAGSEAYLPIMEALDDLKNPATGPSYESVMRSVAPTWLGQLTPGEAGSHTAHDSATEDAPAAASQERMKRELRALLEQVSRRRPLVLVIDDLHWADVSTIDMLNYLASGFEGMRVMVLTCYRPSDMAVVDHAFLGIRSNLQARGVYAEAELDFLSRADVDGYLDLEFPDHALPDGFGADIHRRTDGSPLFMADLVRYFRDSGLIVREDGTWKLTCDPDQATDQLPESVRGMIARKIEQIDDAQRQLLTAAAVQGHEFDSSTLADALDLDAVRVEDQLAELEGVHVFVRQIDEHEFPDRTLTVRYQFVHVLYQNVLFGSLRPARRVQLAGGIADALAAHQRDDAASAARLAVLYETARQFGTSAQYFFTAAQRAVTLFGYAEALSLAERGLEGLTALPDGPDRHQLELGLQMVRGHAQRSVHGWAAKELEDTFARARELCQQLNDPPELFPVQWNLTFYYMIKGDLEVVGQQIALLMEQAESSSIPEYLVAVDHVAGVSNEFLGELVESNRMLERAREVHVPDDHAKYNSMFGIDPGMIARAMSSRPLWSLGYPDQALVRGHETVELGRSQRQPATLVFALIVKQGIHLYRGEAEAAIGLGDEIVAMCSEYEFAHEGEWGKSFQAAAMALNGRVEEGAIQMRAALDALERLRSGLVRPTFLALLGDIHRMAGRVDDGLAAVKEGLEHAERTLEAGFVAELHRVRGELFLLAGDRDGGEASMRAALAKAREQNARSFELRAATSLARFHHGEGQKDQARSVLAPAYDWFTEGFETADLMAAQSLLSEIG